MARRRRAPTSTSQAERRTTTTPYRRCIGSSTDKRGTAMSKLHFGLFIASAGALFVSIAGVSSGCGSSSNGAIPTAADASSDAGALCTGACECTGTTCTCKTGGDCTFGGAAGDGGDDAGAPPNDVTYNCD